jgi:hypothetical protein
MVAVPEALRDWGSTMRKPLEATSARRHPVVGADDGAELVGELER